MNAPDARFDVPDKATQTYLRRSWPDPLSPEWCVEHVKELYLTFDIGPDRVRNILIWCESLGYNTGHAWYDHNRMASNTIKCPACDDRTASRADFCGECGLPLITTPMRRAVFLTSLGDRLRAAMVRNDDKQERHRVFEELER